ncbi:MAG: hydroxymethylbilane synthase [Bdellovibrionaceae bacterium]|nr:hydroxymethylbilane synthase [Bdellovibrionales bacterium]MCB9085663.1 hydroxymethylbilane synthase [Pseudobdellovibrionaceae bacterium]
MRLKIASRQSDLARIQSYMVARALRAVDPQLQIEFEFRTSFGDRNLDIAMDGAQEKGLFTQDFYEGLKSGEFDMVVHSWKDLPVEEREGTKVVATLPRADVRDLLLVKKSSIGRSSWKVLSSSPRRSYNLQRTLSSLVPGNPGIEFTPIRGNIPTRLRKLMEGEEDALILAKAAVDRLLEAPEAELAECQSYVRQVLNECKWSLLPLTLNPAAAAQGALAIEIAQDRPDLENLLAQINCQNTFVEAQRERKILASYGGGCHQKIGVSYLHRDYGKILFLRGKTDGGEELRVMSLEREEMAPEWCSHKENMFPVPPGTSKWYGRDSLDVGGFPGGRSLWVARAEAFPEDWEKAEIPLVWTSGLKSWRGLAARGVWVNGCAESLGEQEETRVTTLLGQEPQWLKLTHEGGYDEGAMEIMATYRLQPVEDAPNLNGKTHFYWMSGSSFARAQELFPEIIAGAFHACGPGNTYKLLQKELSDDRLKLFLNYEDWCRTSTEGDK